MQFCQYPREQLVPLHLRAFSRLTLHYRFSESRCRRAFRSRWVYFFNLERRIVVHAQECARVVEERSHFTSHLVFTCRILLAFCCRFCWDIICAQHWQPFASTIRISQLDMWSCHHSLLGMPINGDPATNAHHAIESQELMRATAVHKSEESLLPILSADLAARKVFANNLKIAANDRLSDTPSTYMSAGSCYLSGFCPPTSWRIDHPRMGKCAHDIEEDEEDSDEPPLPHPTTLDDFALAYTFYTTFNPSFHSSEPVDDDGFLLPILDIGATHCLLPLDWLAYEQAASSTSVRALLYNNMIYCKTVSRPLLSVGQLKVMFDLRFVRDDSVPCLLACSGGLQYVLLRAFVVHRLIVASHADLHVLLEARLHWDWTTLGC